MLRQIESFDYLPTYTGIPSDSNVARLLTIMRWYELNTLQVGFAAGRFGGKALWFGAQDVVSNDADRGRGWWAFGEPIDDGTFGAALNLGTNSDFIFSFAQSGLLSVSNPDPTFGIVLSVRISALGVVEVYTNNPFGTSPAKAAQSIDGIIPKNAFFYIEIQWGSGGVVVRINTIPVISLGATIIDGIDSWGFGRTQSGGECLLDDIYALDDTGSMNTTFLGNVRVQWLPLVGNYHTDWTSYDVSVANFTAASNSAMDDTSYVKNLFSDTGNYDLYDVDPLVNTPLIYGLSIKGAYRQDDATQDFVKNTISSSGTTADGASYATNTSYSFNIDIFETDPHTSTGWLYSGINTIKVGPKQA